jgi:hypothetical protein
MDELLKKLNPAVSGDNWDVNHPSPPWEEIATSRVQIV